MLSPKLILRLVPHTRSNPRPPPLSLLDATKADRAYLSLAVMLEVGSYRGAERQGRQLCLRFVAIRLHAVSSSADKLLSFTKQPQCAVYVLWVTNALYDFRSYEVQRPESNYTC